MRWFLLIVGVISATFFYSFNFTLHLYLTSLVAIIGIFCLDSILEDMFNLNQELVNFIRKGKNE